MRFPRSVLPVVSAGLLLLAACAATPPRAIPAKQPAPYAAASENEMATKAGMAAMERGGSAVDAAIAAALVAGVVVPVSSGIGGGGFALVYDPKTKAATIIDFPGPAAPLAAHQDTTTSHAMTMHSRLRGPVPCTAHHGVHPEHSLPSAPPEMPQR